LTYNNENDILFKTKKEENMKDLRVKIRELVLDNPIIISSGHVTRIPSSVKKVDSFGAGAIVIKYGFLEKEYNQIVPPYAPGLYPDTRVSFISGVDGIIANAFLSPIPVESWAKWIRENKKDMKTPLIASAGAISIEGHVKCAKMFQDAGADGYEFLLGCPVPAVNRGFRTIGIASCFDFEMLKELFKAVREAIDIPIGAKLGFSPINMDGLKIPYEMGLDWVTVLSVFPAGPGIDLEKIEPVLPSAFGLVGSRAAKYSNFLGLLSLKDIKDNIHISATGGAQNGEDIIEYILYGAHSVQMQSVFIKKGFGIIENMKNTIKKYMERKGFESIEEMRGLIIPKILTFDDTVSVYPQTKGKIIASIDMDKCNLCGICEKICIYDAINVHDNRVDVINDLCEGCNVCIDQCPTRAIKLENTHLIWELLKNAT